MYARVSNVRLCCEWACGPQMFTGAMQERVRTGAASSAARCSSSIAARIDRRPTTTRRSPTLLRTTWVSPCCTLLGVASSEAGGESPRALPQLSLDPFCGPKGCGCAISQCRAVIR